MFCFQKKIRRLKHIGFLALWPLMSRRANWREKASYWLLLNLELQLVSYHYFIQSNGV